MNDILTGSTFSLDKMKVVIFGGTAGIGSAVAKRFAAAGAVVVVTGRRESHETGNSNIVFMQNDVTSEASVVNVLKHATEMFGQLDVIINNAGIGSSQQQIVEQSSECLRKTMDVNIAGVFNSLKHAPEFLGDSSSVINTASIGAYYNVSGYGAYSASKAAVISLTRTSAIELGPRGIRVNAVCPGSIQTEMLERNPQQVKIVQSLAPLGRIGELSDIVGVYHFLAARESSYITGAAIAVDGGLLAGLGVDAVNNIVNR